MSLITRSRSQSSLPTLVLHPRTWNETSFQENLVVIALAFALYGMVNLLHSDYLDSGDLKTRRRSVCPAMRCFDIYPGAVSKTRIIVLCRRLAWELTVPPIRNRLSNHRTKRTTLILGFALLALLISTTIYTATIFLATSKFIFSQINSIESTGKFVYCAPTAALTINVRSFSCKKIVDYGLLCWAKDIIGRRYCMLASMCSLAAQLSCSRLVCFVTFGNIWYAAQLGVSCQSPWSWIIEV